MSIALIPGGGSGLKEMVNGVRPKLLTKMGREAVERKQALPDHSTRAVNLSLGFFKRTHGKLYFKEN